MIQIKDVTKLYPAKAAEHENGKERQHDTIHALDHISLHVAQGEWLSIMGPSGSGKSTLVNLIGCLDRPTTGEIWLDSQNVAGMSAGESANRKCQSVLFGLASATTSRRPSALAASDVYRSRPELNRWGMRRSTSTL